MANAITARWIGPALSELNTEVLSPEAILLSSAAFPNGDILIARTDDDSIAARLKREITDPVVRESALEVTEVALLAIRSGNQRMSQPLSKEFLLCKLLLPYQSLQIKKFAPQVADEVSSSVNEMVEEWGTQKDENISRVFQDVMKQVQSIEDDVLLPIAQAYVRFYPDESNQMISAATVS